MAKNELAIMKRGKRTVAHYVKSECLMKSAGHPQLAELLNYLLDCNKSISDYDRLDWIRWLISGGETFDEFAKTVRKYDNATTCGLVWTADFVAYRCRTCGISPCMSLCADCFQAGNHSGHDFNMFRSQAGGACDCGDTSVMKACGFCLRHGPEHAQQQPTAPPELLAVAEAMMPRLLFRLLQHMRANAIPVVLDTYMRAMQDCEGLLGFLHQVSDMGAAMRKILTRTMTNPQCYTNLITQHTSHSSAGPSRTGPVPPDHPYQQEYDSALLTLMSPAQPDEFAGLVDMSSALKHSTILEELLFWVIRFEFPQKLVTLLLSILPDEEYKEAFTRAFVQHYSRISVALVSSGDRSRISNRVVHISVQLLSPESLATLMVRDYHLLHIMLASLHDMMGNILTRTPVEGGGHLVVNCASDVLKGHCYWPIVSDLINVLSHKPIAFQFMTDAKLLTFWFDLLTYFQGMNLNRREGSQHVEYEPDTYYAAFSAELEICSSTMWSMLVHCKDQCTSKMTGLVIEVVLQALKNWMSSINLKPFAKLSSEHVTFHLPLHRHLAVFLSHAVKYQNLGRLTTSVLPPPDVMQMIMLHPLQIQVVFAEIFAGMWVRNGLQIRGQAMTYIQCHFCNSMIDADIYTLQVCALSLSADFFVRTVLERFHVLEVLTLAARESRVMSPHAIELEHEMPMMEAALACLCTVLAVRTQLGLDDTTLTRQEMVSLLSMSDRTHSQLMDTMPEKCGLTGQATDFEPTLKEISDYKAPNFEAGGGMQQGMYVPKPIVWEKHYDPMYVMLRAMYRKDFQASLDRYTAYVKQQGLFTGSGSPWPPLRIPLPCHEEYAGLGRLLHCATMHGMIFTLLHKAVHEKHLTDAVMYYTVYLLELCVSIPPPSPPLKLASAPLPHDKAFQDWFTSNDVWENITQIIRDVAVSVLSGAPMESPRTSCSATATNNPAMYHLATTGSGSSTVSTSSAGTSSEVINAVQAMLEETQQLEPATQTPRFRSTGCSANIDPPAPPRTIHMSIHESMLTLLLQLHSKLAGGGKVNSYTPESLRERRATDEEMESRIGGGVFFVGKLLDKIGRGSEKCRQRMEEIYRLNAAPKVDKDGAQPGKKKKVMDMDERRKRARERQQRVMADFASKQKEFLERAMVDGELPDDQEQEEELPMLPETTYNCVICNQETTSTDDRPVGLVALLQPSSVLGHRCRTDEDLVLPVDDLTTPQRIDNCASDFEKHFGMMLHNLDETSCLLSVNIGWEGGVHVQTCGHHVHLDCHHAYVESLKNQRQLLQTLRVNKGEFQCPLCRQLSNTALPILPGVGPAVTRPLPRSSPRDMVHHIAQVMLHRPITPGSNVLTKAMGSVMEDVTNATYPKYKAYTKSQLTENVLLFVCSVLRVNLELELLQHNGSPCLPPSSSLVAKKTGLLPLIHVLAMHSKILTTKPYTQLWSHVTGVSTSPDDQLPGPTQTSLTPYVKDVPVLLKDPVALLIQLVLTMPNTMEQELYKYFVRALYNLAYIQALTVMTCKFTDEERAAWKTKGKQSGGLEGLMSQVIGHLCDCGLYSDDADSDPHVPAICQSVWSPQSVEQFVQEYCIGFLRNAALLRSHLYEDTDLPTMTNPDLSTEYDLLCVYHGLLAEPMQTDSSAYVPRAVYSADAVHWLTSTPRALVQAWALHLAQFVQKNTLVGRMILMKTPSWHPPRLFTLPRQYDKLFQYYRKKQCRCCNSIPKDAALCLLCGTLICFKESCCQHDNMYEAVRHCISCSSGTGMYVIVQSSVIVVIRGARATLWGSVYLDEHGEEDRDLKRGKPLYLSDERYSLLYQQWITHSFDRACKRWIFHKDNL